MRAGGKHASQWRKQSKSHAHLRGRVCSSFRPSLDAVVSRGASGGWQRRIGANGGSCHLQRYADIAPLRRHEHPCAPARLRLLERPVRGIAIGRFRRGDTKHAALRPELRQLPLSLGDPVKGKHVLTFRCFGWNRIEDTP